MGAQDFVTTVGPWLAGSAGVLTALTTLGRSFGTRRMRSTIRSTSQLIEALPKDGADDARSTLTSVLNIHATRLLLRTQDGVILSKWQAAGVTSAFVLIVNAAFMVGGAYIRDFSGVKESGILEGLVALVLAVNSLVAVLAAMALLVILLGGAERWLEQRTATTATHQGSTAAERALIWVFAPLIWVTRVIRWLWGKRPSAQTDHVSS